MNTWQTALLFLLPTHDYISLPINSAVASRASQRRDQGSQWPFSLSAAWPSGWFLYTKFGLGGNLAGHCWKWGPPLSLRPVTQDLISYFFNLLKTLFLKPFHNIKEQKEENNECTYVHHLDSTIINILPNMLYTHICLSHTHIRIYLLDDFKGNYRFCVSRFKWGSMLQDLLSRTDLGYTPPFFFGRVGKIFRNEWHWLANRVE